jgi:hypothetical protein
MLGSGTCCRVTSAMVSRGLDELRGGHERSAEMSTLRPCYSHEHILTPAETGMRVISGSCGNINSTPAMKWSQRQACDLFI